jgi:hypothetical protein
MTASARFLQCYLSGLWIGFVVFRSKAVVQNCRPKNCLTGLPRRPNSLALRLAGGRQSAHGWFRNRSACVAPVEKVPHCAPGLAAAGVPWMCLGRARGLVPVFFGFFRSAR